MLQYKNISTLEILSRELVGKEVTFYGSISHNYFSGTPNEFEGCTEFRGKIVSVEETEFEDYQGVKRYIHVAVEGIETPIRLFLW